MYTNSGSKVLLMWWSCSVPVCLAIGLFILPVSGVDDLWYGQTVTPPVVVEAVDSSKLEAQSQTAQAALLLRHRAEALMARIQTNILRREALMNSISSQLKQSKNEIGHEALTHSLSYYQPPSTVTVTSPDYSHTILMYPPIAENCDQLKMPSDSSEEPEVHEMVSE